MLYEVITILVYHDVIVLCRLTDLFNRSFQPRLELGRILRTAQAQPPDQLLGGRRQDKDTHDIRSALPHSYNFV